MAQFNVLWTSDNGWAVVDGHRVVDGFRTQAQAEANAAWRNGQVAVVAPKADMVVFAVETATAEEVAAEVVAAFVAAGAGHNAFGDLGGMAVYLRDTARQVNPLADEDVEAYRAWLLAD